MRPRSRVLSGYRVYPAPIYERGEDAVKEVFQWDEAAYREQRLLSGGGGGAVHRVHGPGPGEAAADLLPLAVQGRRPVSCCTATRIRVRIDFIEHHLAAADLTVSRKSAE